MVLRHVRSHILITILSIGVSATWSTPARAQQYDPAKITELEKKLDEILRQADALRQEIERLKSGTPVALPTAPPPDDLTSVEIVTPAEAEEPKATSQEPEPAPAEEVQPVESAPAASTSKIFNPDISVIGTVVGHAGDSNPFEFAPEEGRGPFDLEEVEMALEAFVDPYAKGKFFLAIGE